MWVDGYYQTIRDSSGNDVGPCNPHSSNKCNSYPWLTAFTVSNGNQGDITVQALDYGLFADKLASSNDFYIRFVTTDQFSVHSSNPLN